MKHKSPKQLRIDKKKPGVYIVETDSSFVVHGLRVDKLPPFDEYNPNRIHIARRRRAWKEHTTFPRGWTWSADEKDHATEVDCVADTSGTATLFKDSDESWYIDGVKVS